MKRRRRNLKIGKFSTESVPFGVRIKHKDKIVGYLGLPFTEIFPKLAKWADKDAEKSAEQDWEHITKRYKENPLTAAQERKLWAKYAPYFRYLASKRAPGGGTPLLVKKNSGQGMLFDFHGAFARKADAEKKERQVKGGFIKPIYFRSGMRYGVLTKKNPVGWKEVLSAGVALLQAKPVRRNKKSRGKNPVQKVAGGWRAVERGRTSPVFPSRRDAEIYAESLRLNPQRKINPVRRRNYESAAHLYERFHGKSPTRSTDTGLPIADYDGNAELGQLGKLVSLTVGDEEATHPWKRKIEWNGPESPDLAAEPGGRQLYIVGGNQNLAGSIETFPINRNKDLLDLGFCYQLEYHTRKGFDNFQPVTYYHHLGEETGDVPRLVYDQRKRRIHIVGGAYKVKPEGIVN